MKNIIHWNKQKRTWTSHTWRGYERASVILVKGPWKTECKPEKPTNPRGWVVTSHEYVSLNPPKEELARYKKVKQLIFDKERVLFDVNQGDALLFDQEGCFLVERV